MSSPTPPPSPSPEQIAQAIEQQRTPSAEFPLEVRLDTGQVYKGSTPQEVLDQLVKAQTEASRALSARGAELETLRAQVQTLQQQQAPPVAPRTNEQQSAQEYLQRWAENPEAATKEKVAEAFGVRPEQLPQLVGQLKQQITSRGIEQAADEFQRRCQDFPQSPEVNQMMRQALIERYGMGNLIQVSQDPDKLESTYYELVRQNKVVPNVVAPSGNAAPNVPLPNLRGSAAPPSASTNLLYEFTKLSEQPNGLDKMKEVLERLAAQGHR